MNPLKLNKLHQIKTFQPKKIQPPHATNLKYITIGRLLDI